MANRIKEKYMAGKRYFDYPMLFLVIFLICFGLVMIYSTSSYKSTSHMEIPTLAVKAGSCDSVRCGCNGCML